MQSNIQAEMQEVYRHEIEKWRKERDDSFRSPDGWLSLAGLFILNDGEYSMGSGEDQAIVLPASAPAHLGTLSYKEGKATLTITSDLPVLVDDSAVKQVELVDNRHRRRPTMVK